MNKSLSGILHKAADDGEFGNSVTMVGIAVRANAEEGCMEVVDLAHGERVLSKHRHPCKAKLAAERAVIAQTEAQLEHMKAEADKSEIHCLTDHSGDEEPELEEFYSGLRRVNSFKKVLEGALKGKSETPKANEPSLDDVLKGDELGPRALMSENKLVN